jgi:hypothetical protein
LISTTTHTLSLTADLEYAVHKNKYLKKNNDATGLTVGYSYTVSIATVTELGTGATQNLLLF